MNEATMRTLADVAASEKDFFTAAEIAPVLEMNPQDLRSQAKSNPQLLGFPVIITGKRVRIPREGFLFFCRYGITLRYGSGMEAGN